MRQQFKLLSLIALASLLSIRSANANKWQEEKQEKKYAQLSFITPLGTNGYKSSVTTNSLSINLLYGVSGGVRGFELGGLHNTTKGDVNGFQVAGLGNVTTGIFKGVQFGGLYNIDVNLTTGVQLAGITNVIKGNYVNLMIRLKKNIPATRKNRPAFYKPNMHIR